MKALLVSFAILLSGCAQVQPCTPKVVTVLLAGDSTQLGMTASAPGAGLTRVENGPAELLQAEMDRRFGAGAVVVVQAAAGGSRAVGVPVTAMDRINTFISDIGNRPPAPDITVSNFGINDMLEGMPIESYANALRKQAATIYETPNPTVNGSAEYAQAMRDVARGAVLADVDGYVRALPNWQQHLPDGIHPSSDLYAMISRDVVVPAVTPLVASLRCEPHPTSTKMPKVSKEPAAFVKVREPDCTPLCS